ncbi:MAG TPA: hypothetical protein VKP30_07925 [Polyangiaceae bacterium]|nr:hypothetical protein [Polyangiaceae bacterium]
MASVILYIGQENIQAFLFGSARARRLLAPSRHTTDASKGGDCERISAKVEAPRN